MPTYEYRCKQCGGTFEIYQSIKSDALSICPVDHCVSPESEARGKGEVHRIVSGGAGIVFRGEGFYETDYVRAGRKEESGESGESSSKEESTPSTESSN